jgi:hypothetical protein
MNKKIIIIAFVFCLVLVVPLASAGFFDWLFGDETVQDDLSKTSRISVVNYSTPQWNIIKSDGDEDNFKVIFTDLKDKKTDICFVLKDGIKETDIDLTSKVLYDVSDSAILDDKDKEVIIKYETAKCNDNGIIKDGYHLSLTEAQAFNIDEYIKLGENSLEMTYEEQKEIVFSLDKNNNVSIRIFWDINGDKSDWDNSINNLFTKSSDDWWKFGAFHNGSVWERYKILIESDAMFVKENGNYVFIGDDRIPLNVSDICSKTNGVLTADCQFNPYTSNGKYFLEIEFWSDSDIDPTFEEENDTIIEDNLEHKDANTNCWMEDGIKYCTVYSNRVNALGENGEYNTCDNVLDYELTNNNLTFDLGEEEMFLEWTYDEDNTLPFFTIDKKGCEYYFTQNIIDDSNNITELIMNIPNGFSYSDGVLSKDDFSLKLLDAINLQGINIIEDNGTLVFTGENITRLDPTVGFNDAGTIVNDASAGSKAWSNPDNAKTSNNVYATNTWTEEMGTSNYLKSTNFGFSLPSYDYRIHIVGINVTVERGYGGSDMEFNDNTVKLVVDGVILGDNRAKAGNWGSADTIQTYGNQSDTWGIALDRDNITATDFGFVINGDQDSDFADGDATIDHVQMAVTYTDYSWIYQNIEASSLFTNLRFEEDGSTHITVNDSDILLYMPFDSNISQATAFDYSNNDNDGTINGATYTDDGIYGGAMDFGGGNGNYILTTFNNNYTDEATFGFWMNLRSHISSNGYLTTSSLSPFIFASGGTSVRFYMDNVTGDRVIDSACTRGVDNEWSHYMFTINTSGGYIYKNGVLCNSDTTVSTPYEVPSSIYLGNDRNFGTRSINGSMDEVVIYNHSLSPTEISDLYNNQSARFFTTGTQEFLDQNVTLGADNRINWSSTSQATLDSNITGRIGGWKEENGYNETRNNLLAHFSYDDSFNSTNGKYNGTLYEVTSSANGKYGGSINFDGSANIRYSDLASDISGQPLMTVALWFKNDESTTTTQRDLIDDANANFNIYWGTDEKYKFIVDASGLGANTIESNIAYTDATWHHVVGRYNGSTINLFIDGAIQTDSDLMTGTIDTLGGFDFGGNFNGLKGNMDEVYFFNDSLSNDEIKSLYIKGLVHRNYTDSQEIVSGDNIFQGIAGHTNFIGELTYNSASSNFYTPILEGNLTLTPYETAVITDEDYPIFTNIDDNNGTLIDSGTVTINSTITSTNGTAGVEFDGTNYSMNNVSTLFNASFVIGSAGDYTYFVWAYGNGTDTNFNKTISYDYTINASTFPNIEYIFPTPENNSIISSQTDIDTIFYHNISITMAGISNVTFCTKNTTATTPAVSTCTTYLYNETEQQVAVPDGSYVINATVCNDFNNCNSTENRYFTMDDTLPVFTNIFNTSIYTNKSVSSNFTATDTNFDTFAINWTDTFQITFDGNLTNTSELSATIYYINVTINDSANNIASQVIWVNVSEQIAVVDNEYPVFSAIGFNITNGTEYFGGTYLANTTIISTNGSVGLEFNGVNYTATNVSDLFSVDLNKIKVGSYNYNWWGYGNGTDTNFNSSSVFVYSVVINSSLVLGISGTSPIEYPQITDVAGSGCPSELTCALDKANQTYEAGVETFNYSTAGNENYTAQSSVIDITINQNSSYVLGLTATTPITYGTTTDFTGSGCPAQISCVLNISNAVYSAGTVSGNYSTAGNTNYTGNSTVFTVTINQAIPQGDLTGTTSILQGTAGDVQGSESNTGDGDLTYELFRDGTLVSNPDTDVLNVGTYNYVYNTTGGANYTANASIGTFTLTVTPKNTSYLGIAINISDTTFSSSTDTEIFEFNFNTSSANTNIGILNSLNIEKTTGSGLSVVSLNITIDGISVFDDSIRSISTKNQAGVSGTDTLFFNVSNGEHILKIFARKTGNGAIALTNWDFSMGQFITPDGTEGRGNATTINSTFVSTTPIVVNTKEIVKIVNTSTYVSATIRVSANQTTDVICRFENGGFSPYSIVTIPDDASTRSFATGYITEPESQTDTLNYTCFDTTGANVTIEGRFVEVDMADNTGNTVGHMSATNSSTNYTSTSTLQAGDTEIVSDNIVLKNGTNFLVSVSISANSTTGEQTPIYYVHVENSTDDEVCRSTKERYTEGDIGNAFFFPVCEGLNAGETYHVSAHVIVAAGEELILYDESLTLFENTIFDTTIINIPPVVTISIPEDADNITGSQIINFTATDVQEFLINVTANNGTDTTEIAMELPKGTVNATWDTTSIADGYWNITVLAYENETVDLFTGNATIQVLVDNTLPQVNLVYPTNITYATERTELNYTASDTNLANCWYSLDEGVTNSTTQTCGLNWTGLSSGTGSSTWTVYANDSLGNLNSSSVTFYVTEADTTYPLINFTNPTQPNATSTTNTSIIVNVSIDELNLGNLTYNWNGTNFTIYDDSLILMFNFDNRSSLGENSTIASDLSGYGNNGTISGATWNSTGKYNGGYTFDGKNDYINVTSSSFNFNNSFSYGASFYAEINSTNTQRIISKRNSGATPFGGFDLTLSKTKELVCGVSNISGQSVNAGIIINLNEWYDVMCVVTTTGNIRNVTLYLNGVNVKSSQNTLSGIIYNSTHPLRIGAPSNVINFGNYNGTIDEVRIWNRTLTADESNQQYMSNLAKFNSTHWELFVNQTQNSTDGLEVGSYTYQTFVEDSSSNFNETEERTIIIESGLDTIYPIFTNIDDNNGTLVDSGTVTINSTITASNGTAGVEFDGTNYTMNNESDFFNTSFLKSPAGTYTYFVWAYGNGTDTNFNKTVVYSYTINETPVDNIYPIFTNIDDNNNTLTDSGTVTINSTITNSNGSAGVQFNSINYSMNNESDFFNTSFVISSSGTYTYFVWSYGNGTNNNFNTSATISYTINSSVTPFNDTYIWFADPQISGTKQLLFGSKWESYTFYSTGTFQSSNLTGVGNAYACIDSLGRLYRSNSACV